jgi:hypothetical protein
MKNKKMKTTKEHLELFDEPFRTQALKNSDNDILNNKYLHPEEALLSSFNWGDSPEGFYYWDDYYISLENKNK